MISWFRAAAGPAAVPAGLRWEEGPRWAGLRWAGLRWKGPRWAGLRWAGLRWADHRWAGPRWAGPRSGQGAFPIFFPIVVSPPQCFYIDQFGRCCDRNGWCCDRFGRCGWDLSFGGFPAMATPVFDDDWDDMDDMDDYPMMSYDDFDMDDGDYED